MYDNNFTTFGLHLYFTKNTDVFFYFLSLPLLYTLDSIRIFLLHINISCGLIIILKI